MAELSYEKVAELITDGDVSKQTVLNKVYQAKIPERAPGERDLETKIVEVQADEIHVLPRSRASGKR